MLVLLVELRQKLEQLAEKIDRAGKSVEKIAQQNEACRRLVAMPGVGPVTATEIIATIGNGAAFGKGRDFAAWLGVVPEEHSTGGKQTLWKIPQRGNQYLRRLFVQGARAVMQHRTKQSSGSETHSFTHVWRRASIGHVDAHTHGLREGGEDAEPTMCRAEGMHKHDRMVTTVSTCFIDRRYRPVEELVAEIVDPRWIETQGTTETF